MKSLIPFPDTEAFPAKNGSGYRSMAVIFAGFHTLPIYPLKKHYHGNEVYRTAGDGRTGITERNNPCPPNGSGGTAKGVSQKSLSALTIKIPSNIAEQSKIAEYFQNLDLLITLHQRKYKN